MGGQTVQVADTIAAVLALEHVLVKDILGEVLLGLLCIIEAGNCPNQLNRVFLLDMCDGNVRSENDGEALRGTMQCGRHTLFVGNDETERKPVESEQEFVWVLWHSLAGSRLPALHHVDPRCCEQLLTCNARVLLTHRGQGSLPFVLTPLYKICTQNIDTRSEST